MKILLIGKTGQLGGDILKNGSAEHEILAPGRSQLDICDSENLEQIISYKPDVVINTAAFHNLALCETEYQAAFRVNCIAVRDLAQICNKIGARFVTISTDYVFGGEKRMPYTESDRPTPLQVYGISKLAGEFAALSTAPQQSIVIRTCGLYGKSGSASKGGNFISKRLADARRSDVLDMGCDQRVCPTSTPDLSKAVLQLIAHPQAEAGIYHLVNNGECTWYEFTKAIYEILSLKVKVNPVDRQGLSDGMRRPLYSVLANTKAKALGIELPPWRDALEKYLSTISSAHI